jgi:glycosyltransferase involved in cell wall biosynthesis
VKVAHFIGGKLNGGAGQASIAIHNSLLEAGISSTVIHSGKNDPNYVVDGVAAPTWLETSKSLLFRSGERILSRTNGIQMSDRPFSVGRFGKNITSCGAKADILHLHWISGGSFKLPSFKTINKPIVWTLHDMWPFTGGCHYSFDCKHYTDTCGYCPALSSQVPFDLSTKLQARKSRLISGSVNVVAVSNWLANSAKESSVLRNCPIRVIPNTVDTTSFYAVPRSDARARLNIGSDRPIVLFGHASNSWIKGSDILVRALEQLGPKLPFDLVLFGKHETQLQRFAKYDFGFQKSDHVLRDLYSAADVFVSPSRQEAFGRTVIESMACGTPVVAFDGTGPDDIIIHGETGYLAKNADPIDLASGILSMILQSPSIRNSCIQRVTQNYTPDVVGRSYKDLYDAILASRSE